LPAVLAATRWGFDTAVAVGAASIDDPRWERMGKATFADQFERLRATSPQTTVLAVHGDVEADSKHAIKLHEVVGGERRCIPAADHNCLFPMVMSKELVGLMDEVLAVLPSAKGAQ